MIRSAAVLGLGLIGGSLARDLAARGVRVRGWDADARAGAGVVEPLPAGLEGIERVDVVVLALPVLAAAELLRAIAPRLGTVPLVTDAGSTKRSVVCAAEEAGAGARFVGSHPLAGDHRSGWAASREGLFAGARVFLSPTASSSDAAVGLARSLWEGVGARTETIDAAEHDRLLAWSSHLPQAVSSALAGALTRAGVPREALGPGGRGVVRLAGSSPAMWAEIAADNADRLAPALAAVEAELRALRGAVEAGEVDRMRDWFAAAGEGWST